MKKNVLIVGLGLLGSSLAMALPKNRYHVMAHARRREVIDWAIDQKIIEKDSLEPIEVLFKKADIVVFALPIPPTLEFIEKYQNDFNPNSIITDIGSTKQAFMNKCQAVLAPKNISYVGSHPMAGTEKSGHLNAFKSLYNHAEVFVCSDNFEKYQNAVQTISELWQSISCNTVQISTIDHDELVAKTSHVAHILASALTISVLGYGKQIDNFHGCASGFRDTSRTASSDPLMWREIVEQNREAVLHAMDKFDFEYAKFRNAIENCNFDNFEQEFARGRMLRGEWLNYLKNKENKNGN